MSALEQDLDEYMMGDEPDWDAEPEAPQDADRADEQLRRLAKDTGEMVPGVTVSVRPPSFSVVTEQEVDG